MTLGTTCGIFDRLGYSKEGDANDNISFGTKDRRNDGERAEAQDNGAPGAGATYGRPDEGPQDTTNNREIDARTANHTSNASDKSQNNGDSRNMAQRLSMNQGLLVPDK
jgi:hypothetical protein